MTPRLVWLASFPKSGNTWVRAFLAHYDAETDLAWAHWRSWHGADLRAFHEATGLESTDMTPDEILEARPDVYAAVSATLEHDLVVKVHDAFGTTGSGRELFPSTVSRCVLYLIRHPCDVAVSWAHHASLSLEEAVNFVCSPASALDRRESRPSRQLGQHLGSWGLHVASWTEQTKIPVHVTRYEDLLLHPEDTFAALIIASGRSLDSGRLRRAVSATRFEVLQEQEERFGFSERPIGATRFFREGQSGAWRRVLSRQQAGVILAANGTLMERYGYSDT